MLDKQLYPVPPLCLIDNF